MLRRRLMESGVDYSQMYLTFEAIESGTFTATKTTQYSLDDGATWVKLSSNSNSPTISGGSKIMFKATRTQSSSNYITFTSTAKHNVMGNPYSVIYGDDFKGVTSLSSTHALFRLFYDNGNLVNAKNLSLPATTLSNYCYYYMFYGCTSLTTAPELPATTLALSCYYSMFYNCTSLTTAPELPATTLATSCYSNMFDRCTSLTTAPELPATTLANNCYYSMFDRCTSLTTAPELPATTLATSCYSNMFDRCTSLTTAPELPATTLAYGCYSYMFYGCTSLTTAPSVLLATTLATSCYSGMFGGCTNLTTAPELPATTLVSDCYRYMFRNCTSLNYIKAMFTTTPGTSYTANWVDYVASSGTFVKNVAATWNITGVHGVPNGWTIVYE